MQISQTAPDEYGEGQGSTDRSLAGTRRPALKSTPLDTGLPEGSLRSVTFFLPFHAGVPFLMGADPWCLASHPHSPLQFCSENPCPSPCPCVPSSTPRPGHRSSDYQSGKGKWRAFPASQASSPFSHHFGTIRWPCWGSSGERLKWAEEVVQDPERKTRNTTVTNARITQTAEVPFRTNRPGHLALHGTDKIPCPHTQTG